MFRQSITERLLEILKYGQVLMIGLGLRLVGKGNWKDREVGNIDAEKTL